MSFPNASVGNPVNKISGCPISFKCRTCLGDDTLVNISYFPFIVIKLLYRTQVILFQLLTNMEKNHESCNIKPGDIDPGSFINIYFIYFNDPAIFNGNSAWWHICCNASASLSAF